MKKLSLFLGLTLVLVGCDPVVTYHKIVRNDSSHDIWLIPNGASAGGVETIPDSVLVTSKSSFEIYSTIDIGDGDVNNYSDCPGYPFPGDTLLTRIEGDALLQLSVVIDANADWQFKINEPGRNGDAECRLILSDADVQ